MLITGVAMGLGYATAQEAARQGAKLSLVDFNESALNDAKKKIESEFPGMTKNVALEYGKDGITSNAIAPGTILTPMVAEAFKQIDPADPKGAEKEYAKANPTKRLGQPQEVANVVCFLMSESSSYVSGQVIAIDGGQSNIYGNV